MHVCVVCDSIPHIILNSNIQLQHRRHENNQHFGGKDDFHMNLKSINNLTKRKGVRQAASLFSVNIIGIPLAIVTNIIVTRYLGTKLFGDYKFICSVFNLATLIASFGFFQAGNRVVVLTKNIDKTRGYYGALLVIMSMLFVIMSIGLLIFVQNDNNISSKGLTSFISCIVPLGFIILWGQLYETVLPADNQISLLAKMRLYPKIINLIAALMLFFFANGLAWNKLLVILLLYNGSQLLLYIYVTIKVKPVFRGLRQKVNDIVEADKTFGFNVYIGSLFGVGFGYLTEILISYFGSNNVDVGFYSLALTFTQPLTFIPATIATTKYKSFAFSNTIPRKLLLTTLSLSFLSVIGLWVLVPPFIKYCYGEAFLPVIGINFLVCIAIFFYGMSDFYNRFIMAHGKGARLRNSAFVVGISTLLFNFLLIPKYGAYGAAYSRIIIGIIYLTMMYYYYRLTVKELKEQS